MKRSTIYGVIAVCSMGAAVTPAAAADLTNPAPITTSQPRMPSTAEFGNGPEGGGAELGSKDHIPSAAEFGNGPIGGATVDPTPRRMPTGAEFGNGPAGISQEKQ